MKTIIFIALLALASISSACEWVNPGFRSIHFNKHYKYNSKNWGVGCSNAFGLGIDAVVYENSYHNMGAVIVKPYEFVDLGYLKLSVNVGLAYGYGSEGIFIATPKMSFERGRLGIDVFGLRGAVAFGLKVKL